ncbi:hypothetical protein, partial [Paracoccus hibiscisoli]|uniref:hypothetical protein n=1 Tax=Paracoccus hibiscisoli TaxID=2023261 RepID=UPI0023F2DD54
AGQFSVTMPGQFSVTANSQPGECPERAEIVSRCMSLLPVVLTGLFLQSCDALCPQVRSIRFGIRRRLLAYSHVLGPGTDTGKIADGCLG